MDTLKEAKALLRENWEAGIECPCCKQFVKLYKVKMNGSMVRSLINLYRLPEGYHHVNEFDAWTSGYAGGKFAKLSYWGFAVEGDNDDPTKRTSGYWKITAKGRDFVERKIKVPSHVRLYNRHFYGYQGDEVDITEVIGTKFNYHELMEGKI